MYYIILLRIYHYHYIYSSNINILMCKYQVQRLRLWCEQQLCEYISKDQVCSILCQAHLYEASQLEKVCDTQLERNQQKFRHWGCMW